MAKDARFCFTFYPGDYLRDTQCLSEGAQVAYDRIMCEHMRNICVSQQQLKFFTKKLSEDEKEELLAVLTKSNDGYMISWVVDSILKKQAYSESRAKNREGKKKEDKRNTSGTYVPHMENENEYSNSKGNGKEYEKYIVPQMWEKWKIAKPTYPADRKKDFKPLSEIGEFIAGQQRIQWLPSNAQETDQILTIWGGLALFIASDTFFSKYSLEQVFRYIQSISQSFQKNKPKTLNELQDESDAAVNEFIKR